MSETVNIPAEFDPHETDVAVEYHYSQGRPSPYHIHPSPDDGEPCELDIKTINGLPASLFREDLLDAISELLLERNYRSPEDMDADEGDRKFHERHEEGRSW
jgi:hypothetical protein